MRFINFKRQLNIIHPRKSEQRKGELANYALEHRMIEIKRRKSKIKYSSYVIIRYIPYQPKQNTKYLPREIPETLITLI